jgi:hypothetical protein
MVGYPSYVPWIAEGGSNVATSLFTVLKCRFGDAKMKSITVDRWNPAKSMRNDVSFTPTSVQPISNVTSSQSPHSGGKKCLQLQSHRYQHPLQPIRTPMLDPVTVSLATIFSSADQYPPTSPSPTPGIRSRSGNPGKIESSPSRLSALHPVSLSTLPSFSGSTPSASPKTTTQSKCKNSQRWQISTVAHL